MSKGLKENRGAFLSFIGTLIQQLDERFDEKRMAAHRLSGRTYFPRFGLADAAIIDLAYTPLLILTNDKEMARYLREEKRKQNVFYFGDLKERCLSSN